MGITFYKIPLAVEQIEMLLFLVLIIVHHLMLAIAQNNVLVLGDGH